MLGRPTDLRSLLFLCALAGCGGGSNALPQLNDGASDLGPVASSSDAALDGPGDLGPAASSSDAAAPDGNADLLPDAPPLDAPYAGETGSAFPACVLNA